MVAYSALLAASASLPSVQYGSSAVPQAFNTPSTCQVVTATVTQYASSRPTTNPHGHGGPYFNPYNDVSLPFTWPGKPSQGQTYAPPQPSAPYQYGGPAKNQYQEPCWIPKGASQLVGSLPEGSQCGNSQWGKVDCPRLPVNGLPGGSSSSASYPTKSGAYPPYPTGTGYSHGHGHSHSHSHSHTKSSYNLYPTGSYNGTKTSSASMSSGTPTNSACPQMPDTGVTRTYDLHVAYQTIAPDGVTRNGLTVNGQFPGPLVEANWGDWILLKVTNDLTDEGTSIHAHGLFQKNTSWYDGVPAVAQCPVMPNGGYFEMLFRADRYGTSWYHSHYSAQYSGGAHGPLVIHGPKHQAYDIDVGPVMVEDWFHADYYSLVAGTMAGRFPPSNNVLINGRMNYPCANTTLPCVPNAGVSKFKFESGKKHLLRLINAGAEGLQKFSIDGHKLTIVAVDFIPVDPYTTDVVTLAVGQRTDVIVEAVGKPGDSYWMRSQLGQGDRCTLNDGVSPNALAAVYYESADTNSVPQSTSSVTQAQLQQCKNDDLASGAAVPVCKIPLPTPDVTKQIDFDFRSNGTNFIWFLNNQTYRGDYNHPPLIETKLGNTNFKPEWNVYEFQGAKNVRIHLVNHGLIGGHPMHLHGHDFHVLAEGYGDWDGTVVNSANTVRRDVHQLQNARNVTGTVEPSFMVLQFEQDNPGVWPLHCHLAWHISGGLFMQILERKDDIVKQTFDPDVFDLCNKWDAYTAGHPPDQIDSGL